MIARRYFLAMLGSALIAPRGRLRPITVAMGSYDGRSWRHAWGTQAGWIYRLRTTYPLSPDHSRAIVERLMRYQIPRI